MKDRERPLRVGVWCAVSSKAQANDDKVSLKDQERAGREFATAIDGEVVAVFVVPGHSRDIIFYTDAAAEMPAYAALREAVEAGQLDVLWAMDVDRLGRDPALGQQVISLVEKSPAPTLAQAEVYLSSSPHVVGQKTIGHRYIAAIQSVRAGEDQALRLRRQRMGMKARIRSGMMAARPPYGYKPVYGDGGQVVGYEFTPAIGTVRMLTDLFLQGIPYQEIADRMVEAGQISPGGTRRWHSFSIVRLMSEDTYAGYPHWGAYRAETRSDKYPALWDEEEHQAIIRERERRKVHPYTRRGSSPFAGVVFCARCEEPMYRYVRPYKTNSGETRFYRYLHCSSHATLRSPKYPCHPNFTAEEKIAEAVTEWLEAFSTPARIDEALAELNVGADRAKVEAELDQARQAVKQLDQQRERLALALAAGKMDADIYRRTDDSLLAQIEAAQARIQTLSQRLEALPDLAQRRAVLERLAKEFPTLVEVAEPTEIAAMLQQANIQIWCEDNEVVSIEY